MKSKEKNTKLEKISNRLAKYLSPQIYKNIFEKEATEIISEKN